MFSIDPEPISMLTLFLFIDMVNDCSLDEVIASILKTYISSLSESVSALGFDSSAMVLLMACCW